MTKVREYDKPHIALQGGWWKVSRKLRPYWLNRARWDAAYQFVNRRNAERMRSR